MAACNISRRKFGEVSKKKRHILPSLPRDDRLRWRDDEAEGFFNFAALDMHQMAGEAVSD